MCFFVSPTRPTDLFKLFLMAPGFLEAPHVHLACSRLIFFSGKHAYQENTLSGGVYRTHNRPSRFQKTTGLAHTQLTTKTIFDICPCLANTRRDRSWRFRQRRRGNVAIRVVDCAICRHEASARTDVVTVVLRWRFSNGASPVRGASRV